jgi:preprotein translocase subunit YajC
MGQQPVIDTTTWKLAVLLSPLIAWGLYMKFAGWRERRRKLARQQQRLLEDLRKGKT